MADDTLSLEGLYMARHHHDVIDPNPQVLASIDDIAQNKFDAATPKYNNSTGPRWGEMDRYWAGEHAAFMLSRKQYIEFLPGKYSTYQTLTDIVDKNLKKEGVGIKGAKIAEIGCGSALWSLMLAQRGAKVYLFDKSVCALEYAKFLAGGSYFGVKIAEKEQVKQGDFYKLPEEWAGFFDAVIAGGVLEHLSPEDQNRYFKEVFRILKPGGLTAFTTPNTKSPLNISSDNKKSWFYKAIQAVGKYTYIIPLPMGYHKEGGEREMGSMLKDNHLIVEESNDAVFLAPSAPIEKKLIKGNEIAERFYTDIENMCKGGLINPSKDGPERVKALIEFWSRMGASLTVEERKQIARWVYAVGKKE